VPDAITVYSDYVCPFCYLGRESLARYRERHDDNLRVDWRPFDLRSQQRAPDGTVDHTADDGKDDEYYAQARENVRRLAEQYDVEMALDLATDVDSLSAQVVSYSLREHHDYETWLAFDEAVFAALWEEGEDIGDHDLLVDLATDAGVAADAVRSTLSDAVVREELREQFDEAQQRGVTGVPTFVADGHAARGAVPPEQLARLLEG
jgi:predicted DsbA family dithiol-disulfide isomerase